MTAAFHHGISGADERHSPRTRLSTLVQIRWLAVAGQLTTILVAELATGVLPLKPVLLAVACSAVLNTLVMTPHFHRRLGEGQASLHLAFDIVQLAFLLALTGGLTNPFALFLIAPVAVGAASLPGRHTALLTALAAAALSVISQWHLPLPWPPPGFTVPPLYLWGLWSAVVVGVLSVSLFTWRMAEESRAMAAAYAESQLALERERRVAEIGSLAATVAHELNTPLATICLVAQEMAGELAGSPIKDDIDLLIGQAERCRLSLKHLTQRGGQGEAMDGERVSFPALVEMAAAPHAEHSGVLVLFDHHPLPGAPDAPLPWIRRNPAILLGLGNIIQNATQFARTRVEIDTRWSQKRLEVRVADDGSGFPEHMLERLGEPYTSARENSSDGGHLGLGLFIAMTLLARTGAEVSFANPSDGGAEVTVIWPDAGGLLE